MKFPLLLSIFATAALLSQCTSGPPPAPGDNAYHGGQTKAYRQGYHLGFMDGGGKLEPEFERYHGDYQPGTREAFSHGYQAGFETGHHTAPATPADRDRAYQNGYDAGQADAQNASPPDHRRYHAQFTSSSEAAFREGYTKGYQDARKE